MSTRHLIDPALLPLIDLFPALDFARTPLATVRAAISARYETLPPPAIAPRRILIPSIHGGPDIAVFIYRPSPSRTGGAILYFHGGGMIMGSAAEIRAEPANLAKATGVPVVAVEYRLAPEAPFPAPQQDCHSALIWLAAQADTLQIDAGGIVLFGESAGGGLAAALSLMARDLGGPPIAGQLLVYPMLDHRTGSEICPYNNPNTGEFIWTRANNRYGWEALRGDYRPIDERRGWFSPSLAGDLSNLPPTYMVTGSLDLFFDENLYFAQRLAASSVPIEFHSYAGAIHGFLAASEASQAKRHQSDMLKFAVAMTDPASCF